MHEKYSYKFDADALINRFGGARATTEVLNETGASIQLKAVQKMKARDMMQSDVLATLMMASAKAGKPINLYDYLLERK